MLQYRSRSPAMPPRVDAIPDVDLLPYRLGDRPALPSRSTSSDPIDPLPSPGRNDADGEQHDTQDEDEDEDEDDDDDDDMLSVPHLDVASASSADGMSAPALPAKSARRTSRLLASLSQKPAPEDRPILPHAAPHQIYLSSEEDASSSADDMSDLDELDWDAADSRKSSTASSCSSREDTARVVTVVFHGRPSLVDLVPRKSTGSTDGPRPTPNMLRTATEPTLMRTRSNSSESAAILRYPPRSSSMTPSGFQMRRPQFLTIDPFASKAASEGGDDHESMTTMSSLSRTPKTPSGMLKKTLSLVKKRSRPLLSSTASAPSPPPTETTLVAHASPLEQLGEEVDEVPERAASAADNRESVTYQGIMRNARRNAEAAARAETTSPPTPHRSRFRSGLSISRPRSVRA
ncbi:hypothetical protein XA68_16463 [Ophiocordyceps unilateralis]|uniref:Uncharacterized protein n=1 Tax=Ophiocordyceps unilateralis TaxID=268505 RepID=A0A2A9P6A8_OPHUN|nr:hypothetical protein XA68_16463 [Ophiocordyceps unilateralis]